MNKKRIIIIIILIGIFFLIGISLYFILSPKNVGGEWELIENPEISKATADEIADRNRVFYSFTNPNQFGEGTYKTYFDGGIEEGNYKLTTKDNNIYINMGAEDLNFTISGIKLFGCEKLVITYPEYTDEETGEKVDSKEYIFKRAKVPSYETDSYNSFDIDESLIGIWSTEERYLSYMTSEIPYKETVEFFDNGVMSIHYESPDLLLDRYLYYAYTTKDNLLTFSLVTDKETKYNVSYLIDKNVNLKFINDSTSESIFSDAFFSDVIYYSVSSKD